MTFSINGFAQDVALFGMYLMNGYEHAGRQTHVMPYFQEQNGHLGMVDRLTELALVVHAFMRTDKIKELNDNGTWPGVFEYEVLEPMGAWVHSNSTVSDEDFLAELTAQFDKFVGA